MANPFEGPEWEGWTVNEKGHCAGRIFSESLDEKARFCIRIWDTGLVIAHEVARPYNDMCIQFPSPALALAAINAFVREGGLRWE